MPTPTYALISGYLAASTGEKFDFSFTSNAIISPDEFGKYTMFCLAALELFNES